MKREEAEKRGRLGELAAKWWLRLHGWSILAERVKTRVGEVDLVARKRGLLVFVEVKTRARREDLGFAVDAWRMRRVVAAAQLLIPRFAKSDDGVRIDVILIAPWSWPKQLEDVWREGMA